MRWDVLALLALDLDVGKTQALAYYSVDEALEVFLAYRGGALPERVLGPFLELCGVGIVLILHGLQGLASSHLDQPVVDAVGTAVLEGDANSSWATRLRQELVLGAEQIFQLSLTWG